MSILINAYCTHRNPPVPQFPHALNNRRGRDNPELAPHLDGFAGYVLSRGGQQMTQLKYHLIRHIRRVQHHLSMTVESEHLNALAEWSVAANAIGFLPDGSIRDASGRLLLDAEGKTEAGAEVPYPEDARARTGRSGQLLQHLGIHVANSLPPVIGEVEAELRPAADVARRALALFMASLRGESLATNQEVPASALEIRLPVAFAALSPKEAAFMQAASPGKQQIIDFAWGYEALLVLQWALGLAPDLPGPTAVCDVTALGRVVLENDEEKLVAGAALRPAGDILDALDLHFRLHWAVRQAKLDGRPVPGGIDAGVVQERHRALNWLVRFEDAEWDAVDTPT